MTNPTYQIEVATDHAEAEEFVAWLNKHGHDASIGGSTGNYIDGTLTDNCAESNETMNSLWADYCNAYD